MGDLNSIAAVQKSCCRVCFEISFSITDSFGTMIERKNSVLVK